jgi:hypothetical protein
VRKKEKCDPTSGKCSDEIPARGEVTGESLPETVERSEVRESNIFEPETHIRIHTYIPRVYVTTKPDASFVE